MMYFHDLHRKSTERYNHPIYMVECWAFSISVPTRTEYAVDFWYVNKTDRCGNPVSKEAAIDKMDSIYDSTSEYHVVVDFDNVPVMEFDCSTMIDIEKTTERNGY